MRTVSRIVRRVYQAIRPQLLGIEAFVVSPITREVPIARRDPRDVYLVSYAKSGNTWLRNLVMGVMYGVDLEYASPRLLEDLVPDLHSKRYYARYVTPMFFKWHLLPQPEQRRVVYLLRDGRDVMVSFYHYATAIYRGPHMGFLQMVQQIGSTWPEHVAAWEANPYGAEILWIRYEDLLRDPVAEMRRLCEFVGVQRDDERLARACEQASFAKMRQKEIEYGWQADLGPHVGEYFVRRGIAGSHKDEMPPDVLAAFLEHAGPTLRRLGYLE